MILRPRVAPRERKMQCRQHYLSLREPKEAAAMSLSYVIADLHDRYDLLKTAVGDCRHATLPAMLIVLGTTWIADHRAGRISGVFVVALGTLGGGWFV
jgi:hypothetical protein